MSDSGAEVTCSNCQHFQRSYSREGDGNCLRYPPVLYRDGSGLFPRDRWVTPDVPGSHTCGEFKQDHRVKYFDPSAERGQQKRGAE